MNFSDFTPPQAALWSATLARRIAAQGKDDDTYSALYSLTCAIATIPGQDWRAVYDVQDAVQCVATLAIIGALGHSRTLAG